MGNAEDKDAQAANAGDGHATDVKPPVPEGVEPPPVPAGDDIPSLEDLDRAAAEVVDVKDMPRAVEVPPVQPEGETPKEKGTGEEPTPAPPQEPAGDPEPDPDDVHGVKSWAGRKFKASEERENRLAKDNQELRDTVNQLVGEIRAQKAADGGELPASDDGLPPLPDVVTTAEDVQAVLQHEKAKAEEVERQRNESNAQYQERYKAHLTSIEGDPQQKEIFDLLTAPKSEFNVAHSIANPGDAGNPDLDFKLNLQAVRLHLLSPQGEPPKPAPTPAKPPLNEGSPDGAGPGPPTHVDVGEKPATTASLQDESSKHYAKYLVETDKVKSEDIDKFVGEALSDDRASTLVIKGRGR